MFSTDRERAVAPLPEGAETVSFAVAAPAAHSFEKCAACGTICRPNRSPQLLPCLHSVCKVCIPPAGVEESKRECPGCKRSYNVLAVTDNPLLKDSATGPGTHPLTKCAGCEDTAVSGWCVECGEALCSICVSAHQRVKVTREHTVLPQKLPAGLIPTPFCPTHREEPMKLFCVSCNQLTCRDCQLTFHRNHSYQFLDEAATSQREEIESLLVKVRQQRVTVKQSLQDLDDRLQDLEEIKSKAKSKLQEMLLYIRCALLKRTAELYKNVQDLCGRESEKITEKKNNLKTLEERQEYILSFTERALQMENHVALLSCKRQVHSQLQELLSESAAPPSFMIDVKLSFEREGYRQMATFGKVVSKEVPFSHKNRNVVPKKTPLAPVPRQNVRPAPSSYHPFPFTLATPSSSPSALQPPQMTPASVTPSSVTPSSVPPPLSSAPPVSAVTSCAPLASVSQPSTTSSLRSVHSSSSSAPPTPSCTQTRLSAPPSPASPASLRHSLLKSQLSSQRRNKLSWSFHPYEPKHYKAAARQSNSCSPEPSQQPAAGNPPAPPSLPVASAYPVPSPAVVMVLPPLGPVVMETTPPEQRNRPSAETAKTGPAAVEAAELSSRASPDREEQQQSKSQHYALPVKALADSPCERAPPAGCERLAGPSPPATENEPTSTVTETDGAPPVGLPQVEGTDISYGAGSALSYHAGQAGSAWAGGAGAEICAAVTAATAPNGSAGHAPAPLPVHGPQSGVEPREPPPAALSTPPFSCSLLQQAEGRAQSCPLPGLKPAPTVLEGLPSIPFSSQNRSEPAEKRVQPIEAPHEEGKASNSGNSNPKSAVCQQARPTEAHPVQIPVHPLEKCNDWLPTSLKEILEMPSPYTAPVDHLVPDKNPLLRKLLLIVPGAEAEPKDQGDSRGSPVETEKAQDDEGSACSVATVPENENGESGRPLRRLPVVSVMRLPFSAPPAGQPLPRFRLHPGSTEDEILLQMIEDDDLQPVSLDLSSKPEASSLRRSHKAVQLRCAACRLCGGLSVCAQCGRGFHRDCHIPPISSAPSSGEWQCMLCRDLSEVEDLYIDERPRRPSLSLSDQKKCEHLLLALMCKKYSNVLYRKVELSSHYVDITLIRGRLLRKLSPSYRTPSEFVSDIWVLLESLAKNSEEATLVFKMQKYFQKKLSKTFGDALHPSLLKCPSSDDWEALQGADDEAGKVRETLKRMRAFITVNSQAKKVCQDRAVGPEDKSQGPA